RFAVTVVRMRRKLAGHRIPPTFVPQTAGRSTGSSLGVKVLDVRLGKQTRLYQLGGDTMKLGQLPVVFTACLLVALAAPGVGAETHDPSDLGFIKGITWGWVGSRGEYADPAAADSMQKLAETGADWVCIAFAPSMETYDTPEIRFS